MSITLDGQNLFDEQRLEIELGSARRDSIEKMIAGLDGMLSIDMGGRGRKIKQKGTLRAQSQLQMNERISVISACMNGETHTLVTSSGEEFDNLRMDAFKVTETRVSGGGVAIDYEIVYTQLRV